MAPEDPERRVAIHALSGDLQLLDGRNLAQNGWYVVRTLLATKTTGKVAEWHVEPHTIPNWTRTPVIGFSEVGYHPSQPKRAVIELDANDTALATASLIQIRPDGTEVEAMKAPVQPWGKYLRYNYGVADFSSVKEPGLYVIQYGTQRTGAFPIASDVYEKVWYPTLDVWFPVQMDHMFVNEGYRVWHGAAHLDDAVQAPVNEQHFDAYRTGATTNTPFKPGERIPGLAVGGWFDAGDFDIQGVSHSGTIMSFVAIWEAFHPQRDQTLVDQQLRFVDIHRPDGKPDVLQQIEHGALQIAAQFRAMGRLSRGVVDSHLDTYHHLGDASTQTDNKIYDPSMKPYQTDGIHSGTPDDRWVFVEDSPATSYLGMGALAAASRALRGFNDPLATECLTLAKKAYADERARAATAAQANGPEQGFARFAELTAVMQLVLTTKEQPYVDRFNELLWPALDRAPAFTLQTAVRAMPAMDAAYASEAPALRRAVSRDAGRHVQAEPVRGADRHRRLGRQRAGHRLGDDELLPAQGLSRSRRDRCRHARPGLSLRHASGAQLLVRIGRRQPIEAPGVRQQPRGLLVHRRRCRAGRADPEARLPREHGRLAVSLGRERVRDRYLRLRTSSWPTPRRRRSASRTLSPRLQVGTRHAADRTICRACRR